jgi:DNA mismatch repair ATPase MutS
MLCVARPVPITARVVCREGKLAPDHPFRHKRRGLLVPDRVVGSDMRASRKPLLIVTGANQGGKSTFLRSLGLAQMMMQCGMFVSAESFSADIARGVFTHHGREEDAGMRSGKLDEELRRMSAIVDHVRPGALLLCNESFAATNEREGSEIARQVVHALLDRGVAVAYVIHFYDLAESLYEERLPALFLRPERTEDGLRTFRIIEGEPLPTSLVEDVYEHVFADDRANLAS